MTATGTYIMTDDRRVESHLTTVAKQMLWYPIAYIILVLPIAAARFSSFSGVSVPFAVTIFAGAVFMLTGFVNAVLFCLTRNVLPGTWRQKFGIGSTIQSRARSTSVGSRSNQTWQSTATRVGTVGAGKNPTVLTVDVEKNVEIKYDETDSTPSFIQVGTPTMPTMPLPPPRVHGGDGQQADTDNSHAQQGPYPGPRDARKSIRIETDRGNYRSAGVHPASQANTGEPVVPQHRRNASGGLEGDIHGPASGLESPSFHPFATATPVSPNTRQARPSSILIIGHHANHTHPPWPRSGENGGGSDSGAHWTESNQ